MRGAISSRTLEKSVRTTTTERVGDWSGGDLKRESCAFMEGGVSVQRAYRKGAKEITVKLLKDSPVGDEIFRPPLKVS
jgi:hypothetical protein